MGPSQPAQFALRAGRRQLLELLPPGYGVRVSGASQNLPYLPWVAVLDDDVTSTAREGFYLVYLFAETLDVVYLSMNQGVTAHVDRFRDEGVRRPGVAARTELRREADVLRDAIAEATVGLQTEIDLAASRDLGRAYEAGNVAALRYDVADLPSEASLRGDLERFLGVYRDVVAARDRLLIDRPGFLKTRTRARRPAQTAPPEAEDIFRPKDSSDYIAQVPAQRQRRTRKHEELIRRFGQHARDQGWTAATNVHPRDLVLRRADDEVLVEGKTVGNNAEFAVREAIGQLFSYRHFWYREQETADPRLVALFSEPVGEAFVALLNGLGIAAVWFEDGGWRGLQVPQGLVDAT